MAENRERGAQLWSRLAHEGLGMPIPAVYLPQRSLPADTRGMWGFEPIVTRDAAKPIPYAHCDGPRKWKRAAYTAQSLLAVIGPDDVPSLNPEKLRGLDPMNARDLGRGVSTLWIFNAAIAALHLIGP